MSMKVAAAKALDPSSLSVPSLSVSKSPTKRQQISPTALAAQNNGAKSPFASASNRHLSAATTPGHPSSRSSIAPSSHVSSFHGNGKKYAPPPTPASVVAGQMHSAQASDSISLSASKSRCSSFGALKAVAVDRDILIVDSKIDNIQEAELAAAPRHPYKHHNGTVFAVAYSSDASTIASGGKDGTIAIWDCETETVKTTLKGHTNTVFTLQYSPCGNLLASGSRDGFVLLWDTARNIRKAALKGHTSDVLSVAFSGDGRFFASGSHDQTILIWDMKEGVNKAVLKHHTSAVNFVTFSPDSTLLASGSDDGTIVIFDVINNVKKQKLVGHNAEVNCLTFFPNGTILATAADDKRIVLWDMKTFDPIRILAGHQGAVLGLAFSPDQYLLASCSKDGSVIIWDLVHDYRPLVCSKAAGHRDRVWNLSWSHDSNTLVSSSGDHNLIVWDIVRGHRKEFLTDAHSSIVSSVAFLDLPDAPFRIILRSADETNVVFFWDVETGKRTTLEKVLEQERRARDEMIRKSREDQIRRGLELDELKIHQIPTLLARIEALEELSKQQKEDIEREQNLRLMENERYENVLKMLMKNLGMNVETEMPPKINEDSLASSNSSASRSHSRTSEENDKEEK